MNIKRDETNVESGARPSHTASFRLFMQHRIELVDYATAITGCRSRAEDVVQEAYLRFEEMGGKSFQHHSAGYLFRIVRNLAIDWRRRQTVEDRYLGSQEAAAIDIVTPEATLLYRDELQIVTTSVAELPERTRLALEMYSLGYKLKEVAQRLGISIALAHALVHQGLSYCRRRLLDDLV